MKSARAALKTYFGFEDFRSPQGAVVESILSHRDTLVIMPTGGGKSLCFQLPALLMEGLTLVVSPLIALMKDQVDGLRSRGIAAAMINSSQSWNEQKAVFDSMKSGQIKIVYVSPERFRAESFLRSIEGLPIALFAIDEAHCISQWGHDFRPDYLRLGSVLDTLGRPPCAALTATATPDVRQDILRQLGLRDPAIFVSGFARPNLSFRVTEIARKTDKEIRLRKLIESLRTGIIYCATRKSVEAVAEGLKADGIAHCSYHAGMSRIERESSQEAFIRCEVPVAVATSAFGMGIDRPDIRFVCHYEMPGSVEAYYQEAGRAGRDGLPAVCELLFMYADKRVQDFFVDGANPEVQKIREVYELLHSSRDAQNEVQMTVDAMTEALPGKSNPMAVHTALGHLSRRGYIERFDLPNELMRGTRLLKPEISAWGLVLPEDDLAEKKERDEARLKAVVQMAYAQGCRQSWVLRYFGETVTGDCGKCDSCCRENTTRPLSDEENEIVRKALSGVARMAFRRDRYTWEGRFGRRRILHCLLGKKDSGNASLENLPTFGLLKTCSPRFLELLFNALEKAGLVVTEEGDYPLLTLTESGARVMFNELQVELEWPSLGEEPTDGGSNRPRMTAEESQAAYGSGTDAALYKKLVSLRDRLRKEKGNVPAYTIFPNKVLEQLAALSPETLDKALGIKGIGEVKATTLLPQFLAVIREHHGATKPAGRSKSPPSR